MAVDLLKNLTDELASAIDSCSHHPAELPLAKSIEEARQYWEWFQKCRPDARARHLRYMAQNDLYFLGRYILGWHYAEHPFQFERAREVQASPNGHLDLWSRGHMKSHWVTFGLTIQAILNDPDVTVAIFSHTRPIAKGFLRVIKQVFEQNELLKTLFPDILWKNPANEAPKWSEDDGICVKRKAVRLEQTVEAWGLTDGQPTSKHFSIRVYDDVVTLENVTSRDMIEKTTNAWEISLNLALPDTIDRYVGTFYHENDTYHTMIDRGSVKVRRYPIFNEEGPQKGLPCFFTPEQADQRKRDMGPRNFALQCLLDPKQDTTKQRWDVRWLQRYSKPITHGVNVYILVDPASKQKKDSDWTVIHAVGLGADRNYYYLDGIRDRLSLKDRTDALIYMHQKFTAMGPGMKPRNVGYESYGKDSDIEHITEKMAELSYRFNIEPLGGRLGKYDRINKLQPLFEELRWFFPLAIYRKLYDGTQIELISQFIQEEYAFMPDPKHDDFLDGLARILDPKLGATFPFAGRVGSGRFNDYDADVGPEPKTWMGI